MLKKADSRWIKNCNPSYEWKRWSLELIKIVIFLILNVIFYIHISRTDLVNKTSFNNGVYLFACIKSSVKERF